MTPLFKQAIKEHSQEKCPDCQSKWRWNIGTSTGPDGVFTVWACGECDQLMFSKPKCCITGCGYIDTHCKCEESVIGIPRLMAEAVGLEV